jgi:hypothetical protein
MVLAHLVEQRTRVRQVGNLHGCGRKGPRDPGSDDLQPILRVAERRPPQAPGWRYNPAHMRV